MTGSAPPAAELTVLVVTWQARELALRCLGALGAQTLPRERWAVHVLDNGSDDGTVEALRERHPDAHVQRLEENRGFAGGCAAALAVVASPYVVLVNNDATPEPDFLERLVAARDADLAAGRRIAAWTGRVLLAEPVDGRAVVNTTGVLVHRDGNGADRDYLVPADESHPPAEVFGFNGAAALLDTAAVREAGGFDASYFLYYEDTDLSWRLRLWGYDVRYVHDAVVRHEHGASTGLRGPVFRFHNERNRLVTLVKDAPWALVVPVLLRHPVMSLVRLARGGEQRTDGVLRLRAYGDLLRRLPGLVAARRALPPAVRGRRAAVARLLTR